MAESTNSDAAAASGEWEAQLAAHRSRLRQMVAFRLDRRLAGRVDPSDVIQETYLEATTRRHEFEAKPQHGLFLWLRFLALQKVITLHRHHVGRAMRSANKERPIEVDGGSNTSAAMAIQIVDRNVGPGSAVAQAEMADRLTAALDLMEPTDREVLALRHFEQLTNAEAADVLGLTVSAASKRYLRALARLKQMLTEHDLLLSAE
ncbi:MAG TPA: sigma-70 family RNA polymerase sigma factor [Gemmatales bacterium]|nr:sigma-70 family RNA polymerase sigma factor [Gemmatales bacterium]HMP60101.1 sigma-70 family RNA polymerase sigma factor [Gemmatales bacterium]